MLEAKKVKNLEIRPATNEDIERNRERELELAAQAAPVVHAPVKGSALSGKPWVVDVVMPRTEPVTSTHAINTHNLVVWGEELVGSWWHAGGCPQLHVVRGPFEAGALVERAVLDLPYPRALLTGACFDKEGRLWAGGGSTVAGVELCVVYHSNDRGRTWQHEPVPEALRGPGIQAVAWLEDALFVMNQHGIMRRSEGSWDNVQVPAELMPRTHLNQRFVITGGQLYFLGKGVARWNGTEFVAELLLPEEWSSVGSLTSSSRGTLIAGSIVGDSPLRLSAVVWRKPQGGAWEPIGGEALGIDPDRPLETANYQNLLVVGKRVVLVDSAHQPWVQRHLLRVSEDDGLSFRLIDIPATDGTITVASAVADPGGGVTVAGFGGLLLRLGLPSD